MAAFILGLAALCAAWWFIQTKRAQSRGASGRQPPAAPRRGRRAGAPTRQRPSGTRARATELETTYYQVSDASTGLSVEEVHPDFYGDVASMLEQQIAEHPSRTDLHTALLDLHHASGRKQAFSEAATRFARLAGAQQWMRVLELGLDLGIDLTTVRSDDIAETSLRKQRPAKGAARASEFESHPEPAGSARRLRHYDLQGLEAVDLERCLAAVSGEYKRLRRDVAFLAANADTVAKALGRPTPLQFAAALTAHVGGARIYFKREDLRPADSECLINALGQAQVARFTGRQRLVCGSCSGGAAKAYATAARAMNMHATIFVPSTGFDAQALGESAHLDVERIAYDRHGDVDPRGAALSHWIRSVDDCLYVTGLKAGPDPYPTMVSDFQALTGHEVSRQLMPLGHTLPAAVISSLDCGFTSLGVCQPFLERRAVALSMVGVAERPRATPTLPLREHTWLAATGRVDFAGVEATAAESAATLCRALEDLELAAHNAGAVAQAMHLAKGLPGDAAVVVLLAPAAMPWVLMGAKS